ncbi:uncharacterized protein LOC131665740 [Phymastichus coffea]|uniref:uncharacterized protein LOC131665740 n=1 Tax=Phymastichus coffea TaxID=108790 RepID=UPI00273CCBD0|nr:uncharacterized protein LOC131665740 [Phymastichus coffea]XP_058793810.1 uncharacterized protein LOC131665740 [Phymastichus coffea]
MILDRFSRISKLAGQLTAQKLDLLLKTTSFSHKIYKPCYFYNKPVASNFCTQRRYLSTFSDVKYINAEEKVLVKDNVYTEQQLVGSQLLESSEAYSNSVPKPMKFNESLVVDNLEELLSQSWISMSNSDIIDNFERLSHYAFKHKETIEDEKFHGVLEVLKSQFINFSDSDIRHVFKCLQLWNIDKTGSVFTDLWKTFEIEIIKRYSNWTIDEILFTSHLYYKLKISRGSEYTWHSLKKIARKPQNMHYTQLIHLTFLMKMNRKLPLNMYNIEYYVEQQVDKLTLNELGIFALTFSQYDTPIRSSNFIQKFLDKLIAEVDTVNEIYLTSLLNIIRINPVISDKYMMLLQELERNFSRWSIYTLTAIANAQTKTLMHSETLMSKILERFETEIKNLKIKQMGQLMLTLLILGYNGKTTPFVSMVIHELLEPNRVDEIEKFSKVFIEIIHFALLMNFFSKDTEKLCRKIFDPKFIENFSKNDYYNLNYEYLQMSYCLEFDHPEYNGPKLDEGVVDFLCKAFGSNKSENNLRRPENKTLDGMLLSSIEKICKRALKSEYGFYRKAVLPHFAKAFGIICYDPETKEYGSPKEKLSQIPWNLPKYAPADGKEWFALIMGSKHQVINNSRKPVGKVLVQIRHLEKIGYKPIFIPHYEWDNLSNNSEKEKYILDNLHK